MKYSTGLINIQSRFYNNYYGIRLRNVNRHIDHCIDNVVYGLTLNINRIYMEMIES